jgi:hypothetical protein
MIKLANVILGTSRATLGGNRNRGHQKTRNRQPFEPSPAATSETRALAATAAPAAKKGCGKCVIVCKRAYTGIYVYLQKCKTGGKKPEVGEACRDRSKSMIQAWQHVADRPWKHEFRHFSISLSHYLDSYNYISNTYTTHIKSDVALT